MGGGRRGESRGGKTHQGYQDAAEPGEGPNTYILSFCSQSLCGLPVLPLLGLPSPILLGKLRYCFKSHPEFYKSQVSS